VSPTTIRAAAERFAPLRISEIVLKTAQFERLRDWYTLLLGTKPYMERKPPADHRSDFPLGPYVRANDMRICFIQVFVDYPYKETLGIFEVPVVKGSQEAVPGLHHMQFRHATLNELVTRYEQLAAAGVEPYRTANHGTGTSFYYRDPDGNTCELSGPNFATLEEDRSFTSSEAFRSNPSGVELDIRDFVRRFRAGEALETLLAIS
jgi:catechol 2,3-dioxygenase-like lactoylglutathione lyase family enzyme